MLPVIEALEERVVLTQTVLQVTSLADTGAGTLRALLAQAQTQGLNALVEFAPNLAGTISLSGPLTINNDQVAIQGPGAHSLTIRNANNTGIFDVAGNGVLSSIATLTLMDSNTQATGTAPGAITAEATTGTAGSQTLIINGVVFETSGTPANASTPHDSVNLKAGSTYGTVIVGYSTFLGNSSQGTAISSDGVEVAGPSLIAFDSTFEDYTSAIKVDAGSYSLNVYNSTFEGNNNSISGAAISADPSVLTTLTSDTFANNVASNTGAVISAGNVAPPAALQGSIVYGNTITGAASELAGTFASSGYNDLQSNPGFVGGLKSTDLVGTNPLLAGLGDYGGSSPTDPPEPGSPVLTKGAPGGEASDERGNTRSATAPSIGAEEGSGVLFTVNSTGDNGGNDPAHDSTFTGLTGTLRKAIVDANFFQAGTLAVQFAIPSAGQPQEITLANTLDTITAPVVIDGSTQNGFTTHAIVKVEENGLATTGLTLAPTVGTSEVLDLSFDSSAGGVAIRLQNTGTSSVLVAGDILGHDADFADVGGLSVGIRLTGASNDTIGGVLEDDRDVFSGAGARGIDSDSASNSNLIEGSYFGTAADGVTASPFDGNYGIVIAGTGNTIGGTVGGAGNVIGGVVTALEIDGNSNLIQGNRIGVNALGGPLPDGVGVVFQGHSNTLGGTASNGAGNLVENATIPTTGAVLASGDGIFDASAAASVATSNVIQGNTIESNQNYGIYVELSAASIGGSVAGQGNTIAANAAGGVVVLESSRNGLIQGNTFGFDVAGVGSANGPADITLEGGSAGDTIGGLAAGQGNVFFGTASLAAILIDGDIADTVEGNQIGTDFGSIATSNLNGIVIRNGSASVNVIGNTIAGATNDGVEILGSSTIDNVVSGNLVHDDTIVGIYVAGSRNTIGGSSLAAGNVLYSDGSPTVATTLGVNAIGTIQVDGASATSNLVEYNDAGYDDDNFLGSGGFGIAVTGGASNNTLTGNVAGLNYEGDGILIDGVGTSNNLVTSNDIGTDETGTNAEFNNIGLEIEDGASGNNITFNVISGNENQGVYIHDAGTTGNTLFGDFIGTALGGNGLLQSGATNSGAGIEIGLGASSNRVTSCVISGSYGGNVLIDGALTELNRFDADEIGTNQAGTAAIEAPFGPALGVSIVGAQLNIIGPGDVISGNLGDGVSLSSGARSNQIIGDVIGLNMGGTLGLANQGNDIVVSGGSTGNTIGGIGAANRNVISGANSSSTTAGVLLTDAGTTGNVIEGNFIGLNEFGNQAIGNATGVLVHGGASSNTIGGTVAGAGNVISGNAGDGIELDSTNTQTPGNVTGIAIQGNDIGTDSSGQVAIPNTFSGIYAASNGAGQTTNITIGGTTAAARNVISGNVSYGVYIVGAYYNASDLVEGNYIGVNFTGNVALPNAYGVFDADGINDTIGGTVAGAGNVISGNDGPNVYGAAELESSGFDGLIAGNIIGLAANGSTLPGASLAGVWITNIGGVGNTIGGLVASARNVISGNVQGIILFGDANTLVEGNYIGTDLTGTVAIGNGPAVFDNNVGLNSSTNDTIGGTTAAARNIISGGAAYGIALGTGSVGTLVEGNYIGTDVTGTLALPNYVGIGGAPGNTIGGATSIPGTGAGNLIAGNSYYGIAMDSGTGAGLIVEGNAIGIIALPGGGRSPANGGGLLFTRSSGVLIGGVISGDENVISGNATNGILLEDDSTFLVQGNLIGTDITGKTSIGNGNGLVIEDGSSGITVGGTTAGARNVISGNSGDGIDINGATVFTNAIPTANVVEGDYIGTDITGEVALANASNGISIDNSSDNTIGGTTAAARDVISGNGAIALVLQDPSTIGNIIEGDYIGTDALGSSALANVRNIVISDIGTGNAIGLAGAGNVIAACTDAYGFYVTGAPGLVLQGNKIGTNAAGTAAIGNLNGPIISGADNIVVGGTAPGDGNLFSGNGRYGMILSASTNATIQGNLFGTDISGTYAIGNGNVGLSLQTTNSLVGGLTAAARNIFSGNAVGILISGAGVQGNLVEGNFIGTATNGIAAIANLNVGLRITATGLGNTIGSTVAGGTNVISANLLGGIDISASNDNLVQNNQIGVTAGAKLALGNAGYGVLVEAGSVGTTIGGLAGSAANAICATATTSGFYGFGIGVTGGSLNTVIMGNVIGGLTGFGNVSGGIDVTSGSVTIGGNSAPMANLILANGGPGITIGWQSALASSVAENRIAANSGLGIAVDFTGDAGYPSQNYLTTPTLNISGGALNAPVIGSASIVAGLLTVTGYARPGSVIEFDAAQPDTTGFGQGAVYLGTFTEGSANDSNAGTGSYSNGSGSDTNAARFSFTFAIPSGFSAGTVITAISDGTLGHPSVSEYGKNYLSDLGGGLIGPVLNAGANATILVGQTYAYRGTFGDDTSANIAASVNYGDGSGIQSLTLDPTNPILPTEDAYTPTSTGYFELNHVFTKAGSYSVLVTLTDDDGLSSTTTLMVTVAPAPAKVDNTAFTLAPESTPTVTTSPAIVGVDQCVLLKGKFTDTNTGDVPSVEVIWGDGHVSSPMTTEVGTAFSFSIDHPYTAPSSNIGNQGLYPVSVLVTTGTGQTTSTTGGLFYSEVVDTAPSALAITPAVSSVAAGGSVSLAGSFVAPHDAGDVYHVSVNWGDGSTPTKFDVVDGSAPYNTFSGIVHPYLAQPIYLAGTPDAITVTVTDQYQPLAPALATASVTIVAATGSSLSIATDHSTINEGGTVSLSGTLAAAVPGDPHNLTIQWGDGTSTSVLLASGQTSFSATSTPFLSPHGYAIHGSDPIRVTATDPERPDLASASASTIITVLDLAPSVSLRAPTDIRGNVLTQALENSTVVVTGSYTNPGGVLEHDGVTINWGDGTTSTAAVNSSLHTFTASHKYGQVAGSSQSATQTITATATDSTGLSGSASTPLVLAHLTPTVTIGSSFTTAGRPMLSAPVVSGSDTASTSYTWTIGTAIVSTTSTYPPVATPGSDTSQVVSVSVKLTSLDGYVTTIGYTTQLDLVDDTTTAPYAVPGPASAASSSIVIDVVGNKTLVGGTLVGLPPQGSRTLPVVSNPLNTPISFDGNGNETYVGDSVGDTFNLHSGTSIAYGMANANTFNVTPNCNLTVVASSRQNTLNFSGSSYGVQFDLTQDGGQPQYVDPLDPTADHVVAINDLGQAGAFSTLVCSNDGDKITAAASSTIVGGGGMDTVTLGSPTNGVSANNVTVDASTLGNVINATSSSLSNFTFNGDANPQAIGPVSFLNQTTVSNASFYGDQGTTTFGNGTGATSTGSINFTGDQGTTTFNNGSGATSTGSINFSGDQATSTLNNGSGSTFGGMVNFTGDQATSTFNNGANAVAINFSGDQATSTFGSGTTTTNATVNFSGDQATTTFNNGPGASATGSVNFTGDQATSTFNNGVTSGTTTVNYSGDQATSTLSNGTSTASVNFTGDQATSTFNNGPGATQSVPVNFSGDQATSTFNNGSSSGSATVQVNYGGDQSTTTFSNSTTASTSTVNFSGDGGASNFNNGPNATLTSTATVLFSGDQATSTFNNGSVAISANFTGDQATTTFGSGTTTTNATVNFTGDQATTTFNNGPGASAGGMVNFTGDQATSTFNNGVTSGTTTVNYSGDQATSTLSNGTSTASVNFTGDQATSTFNNGPGATQSGPVNFSGDQATSTFNNGSSSGSATVTVNYGGDQATTTFNNATTASTSTVNFSGDGGASTFNNAVGAILAGMVDYSGDQATNTFNNASGASQVGTINYGGDLSAVVIGSSGNSTASGGFGDQTSNTFNNASGAASTGTINFGGDQATNTFNNSAGATSGGLINYTGDQATNTFNNASGASQVGTINYGGDQATSTFSNAASTAGTINYSGDGNTELDWNRGAFASGLSFAGSALAASSTLINTGTIAGNVTFLGNGGTDAFANGAIVNGVYVPGQVNGSVLIYGGLGSGTFLNDGPVSGSITFIDGARTVGSVETLANLSSGTVGGNLTLIGAGGADTLQNSGSVTKGLVFQAGTGTNTMENDSSVGSIQFTGLPTSSVVAGQTTLIPVPTNEVLNTASGVASIVYTGGAGGNLLENNAPGTGSIVFTAFGADSVLENFGNGFGSILYNGSTGLDSLINTGNANLAATSTLTYNPAIGAGQATDTLENSGNNLASVVLAAGAGLNQFSNTGSNIALISVHGGATGGIVLNSGSNLGALDDVAGGGQEVFNNGGLGLGSIGFQGTVGTDSFYNTGSAASLAYAGGTGSDVVINAGSLIAPSLRPLAVTSPILVDGGGGPLSFYNAPGATLSGIDLVGVGAFRFENAGTLNNSTIDATGATSGQFLDDASGTLVGDTYKSSPGGDTATSYGSINGFTFVGGAGAGTLNLYGPENLGIIDIGGSAADSLVIGTYAGNVSGIVFDGGLGADLLAVDAANVSNVTLNAGLGSATFWSLGAYASGLTLIGGAGEAVLDNSGAYANNLSVVGGSGGATLYNTGNNFGLLSFTGGSGDNALTNTGLGTSLSALDLTGGTGDNTLTNAGNAVGSLLLQDGPGINAIDSVVNSGVGVGSIVLTTNAGVSSLINTAANVLSASGAILTEGVGSIIDTSANGSPSVNNSGGVGALNFRAGTGDASLVDSGNNGPAATIMFLGGGPDDTFIDSATAASALFNAGAGGSQVVINTGATGAITLVEGSGNDNYTFEGSSQAAVTLNPPTTAGAGVDTLDFSSYLGGGLVLDLMKTTIQAIAGGLSLTLGSPTEVTHVVGTQFTNTVYGNTLADTLDSADLPDPTLKATSTTPSVPNAKTQWAYLDFTDDADPVAGQAVHSYTAAEQQTILQAVEADYWGPGGASSPWFNVDFTTTVPNLPAGSYATLYFNDTPPSGEPGGEASEVDFGNLDAGGYAAIQVNGLLGGQGQPTNTTSNFDTLSAKIAAHEFAHLLGVRHSDAFGPIGYGIHTPPGSSDFNPSFSGPNAAFESFDHIISSPATEGTDRFNDLRPLDFGPREAIKIAFGEQGTIVPQASGAHSTMSTATSFPLSPLSVPNTDVNLADLEQGMTLQVLAGAVAGSIGIDPTTGLAAPDYFSFSGKQGDDFTIETESQELAALANGGSVDTVIEVFDSSGKPVSYYGGIAQNDDQFEGSDSLLDDVILPATGTYYVKVTSYAAQPGDPNYDPTNPASPLSALNTESTLNPANPAYSAAARAAYIAAGNGTATGQFDLFLYKESQADPLAKNVNNLLVARTAGSTLVSAGQGDTLVGGPGTDTYVVGGDTITLTSTAPASSIDLQASSLFGLTISDTAGQSSWPVTINYGDGTSTTGLTATSGRSLAISHLYPGPGSYTVTVSYTVGGSLVEMTEPVNLVETQAPASTITALPTGTIGINTPATFSASLQNPYLGTNYTATWTFTNQATLQKIVAAETVLASSSTPSLAFTLSEGFAAAGTYLVQLTLTNPIDGLSAPATLATGVSTTFTIVAQVGSSVTVTLPAGPTYYNAQSYAPPSSSIVVRDSSNNVISNPSLTYTYTQTINGVTTTLTNPPIDAGTYRLVVHYAGDSTHLAAQSQPVALTISPATPSVSLGGTKTQVYNAQAFATPTITVLGVNNANLGGSGVTLAYSQVTTQGLVALAGSPKDAGSYQVVATDMATTDYTTATSAAFSFTITQATPTVTLSAASATYTASAYAGALTTSVNGTVTTSGITYTYYSGSTSLGSTAPKDAGSYTVTATYAGSLDYAMATSAPAPFTVTPAALIVTINDATKVYGQDDHTSLSGAIAGLLGTDSATANYTSPGSSSTADVGSYAIAASLTAGGSTKLTDYAVTDTNKAGTKTTGTLTITQATPTVSATAANATYTASAYAGALTTSVNGTVTTAGLTYTYYSGSINLGATAPKDAGSYTVTATYAGSTDYATATSAPAPFTVTPAALIVTINDATKVYGQDDHTSLSGAIAGLLGTDSATATYTSPGSSSTADVGSYAIAASLTAGGSTKLTDYAVTDTNKAGTKTTGTLTITQATPTVSATAANATYTASAYAGALTTTVNGTVTTAGLTYTYYSGSTNLGATAPKDAGSYSVTATYAGSLDYAMATSAPAPFTVTPAALVVTISDTTKVYGQDDHTSLSGAIAGLLGTDSATATYTSPGSSSTADVGSYAIAASLTAGGSTKLTDYAVTDTNKAGTKTTGTLTITQATPTVSATAANATYTASAYAGALTTTVNGTVTTSGLTYTYYSGSTSLGSTAPKDAGSYTVTATYAGSLDYAMATSAPAPFTISAEATTITGSASAAVFGSSTTLTGTVKAGVGSPVGSVDFYDTTTGVDLGSATVNGSGVATLAAAIPPEVGSQTITLTYRSSSADFNGSSTTTGVSLLASIYVLNPTASGSLNVSGSSVVSVPGTIQVASNSSSAIVLSGSTKITAPTIGVGGGTSVTGSSSIVGTLTKGVSVVDPLAGLPIPSASGLTTYAAVNIGGVTSQTISPGIYPSINVGASARLTMLPGIYVIDGGGFSLSGAGVVTGSGVFIYNAGSNYNGGSGSSFGSFNLSAGTISLTPMTTGPYAGIGLFQSRDNTRALSISGAVYAGLGGGAVYAPSAVLQLSGSAQIGTPGQSVSPLIVNELSLTGATGAYQRTLGAGPGGAVSTFNWITDPVLTVSAQDDDGNTLDPAELADLGAAMTYLNQALASFGVDLSWAPSGTNADVTVHFAATSPAGGASDGVLGYTTPANDVYLVTGWDYFTASDPGQIGSSQYDFTTLAVHELAHTLGLGESLDTDSVMYEFLEPGTIRRTFTDANLVGIDSDADRFMKVATPVPSSAASVDVHALDSALAALDPNPDAASTLATSNVHRLDAAIASVVEESYFIPLEIAQGFAALEGDDASPIPVRKPTVHLA